MEPPLYRCYRCPAALMDIPHNFGIFKPHLENNMSQHQASSRPLVIKTLEAMQVKSI